MIMIIFITIWLRTGYKKVEIYYVNVHGFEVCHVDDTLAGKAKTIVLTDVAAGSTLRIVRTRVDATAPETND